MKFFDYIIEIGLIVILIFAPLAFGGVEVWSVSWIHFATLFLIAIWVLKLAAVIFKKKDGAFNPFSIIDIPILVFLIWAFVLTLCSNIPQASREEFLKILNYILIYYLIVGNLKMKQAQRLTFAIIIVGSVIAIYGLVQKLQGTEGIIYNIVRPVQYRNRVSGTYICPNHFSGYLEMALSLCLGLLLFSSFALGWKMLLGYAGLLMGAGIFLSISRGGYLSIAGAGIFLFILGLLKKRFRSVITFALIITLLFLAFIFLGKENRVIDKETVLGRCKAVLDEPGNASQGRIHFWKSALEIIKNNPISGTGPGTFKWHFPRYRHPRIVLDLNYAHNDYLHYMVDYGGIGLGLILLFFVVLFGQGFSLIKQANPWGKAVAGGVLASAVALLIHSIFDFNFHIPANAITFVVLIGLMRVSNKVTSCPPRRPDKPQITSYKVICLILGLGLVLVVLFAAPVAVRHYLANIEYKKGLDYKKEILWDEALDLFEKAFEMDRDNFLYPAEMADLYLNKSRFKEEKENYLRKALEYSKETIRLNPQYASQYITQALIYENLADIENAKIAYTQALELDPNNAYYHQAYGLFYLREGKKGKAETELEESRKLKSGGLTGKLLKKLK